MIHAGREDHHLAGYHRADDGVILPATNMRRIDRLDDETGEQMRITLRLIDIDAAIAEDAIDQHAAAGAFDQRSGRFCEKFSRVVMR